MCNFLRKRQKTVSGAKFLLNERRRLATRMNITFFIEYKLFYLKLDAKNFYIKQLFRKKECCPSKLQKTVLGAHLTIFQGKETSKAKN